MSVAVLVDGRYTTNENGEQVYTPRSDEELEQIEALVRSAVGFDEDRGDSVEVVNMAFAPVEFDYDPEENTILGFEKNEVLNTAEMIMLVVMGILIILLVLRPLVSSVVASQQAAAENAREEAAMLSAEASPAALSGPSSFEKAGAESDGDDMLMDRNDGEEETMINMQSVEGKVKASSVKKVGDIVENHPNETVAVIRNWMSQE